MFAIVIIEPIAPFKNIKDNFDALIIFAKIN
jgi:hypothetical protein